MTAITKCPECGTRFKVTAAQLEAHEGLVRCGRCSLVFNANEFLQHDEPSPQLSLPIDAEPAVELPADKRAAPVLEEAGEPPALTHAAETETEAGEEQQAHAVEELTDEVPQPRKRRWPGILAAMLLTLALLAQAAYYFRVDLAAQLPGLKPLLVQYCSLLGCTVELPARAELMSIESSELESDRVQANLITLHALLRNRATFAQSYPSLELTLTDMQDKPVARRIFHPVDYLKAGSDMPKGLAANRELDISLHLDTGELRPTGYRLFLFYPQHP